jgi:hypothetical protein
MIISSGGKVTGSMEKKQRNLLHKHTPFVSNFKKFDYWGFFSIFRTTRKGRQSSPKSFGESAQYIQLPTPFLADTGGKEGGGIGEAGSDGAIHSQKN